MTLTDSKQFVLTALDRCDRCSSQAYVLVKGMAGELMFCSHHYNKIMNDKVGYQKMVDFMFEIVDERDRLVENKAQGDVY